MSAGVSILIVAATLVLMLVRPRGIGEAWVAAGGASAMLLAGQLHTADVRAAFDGTADVLLFLLGMMVLTALVEQAGVFERLAEWCARLARGSGRLLFVIVFLIGAVVTALLSLDVTVIMLTPIVYAIAVRRRLDALPFMFACTFVANTASLVLPISNLTNLLVYHQLNLDFVQFAAQMWVPNLVAVAVNLAIFLWLFRDRLPVRFELVGAEALPAVDWWLIASSVMLTATLIALVGLGLSHHPLAWGALAGGALLFAIGVIGRKARPGQIAREISWPLFVFVIGMFLVVRGLEHAVLEGAITSLPTDPARALITGAVTAAIGSNIVNNVPMTLLALSLADRAAGEARSAFAYGTLLGANIGPTLTTYGSLATMLWLTLIRKRGIDIKTGEYLRVGLLTMPLVL
ncbi:MAG TPA: SLC13 family permease, partial [Thermomicrobiales bacterium]|nr:SLC13 family permease [Thermomicrobiales bacterium]